MRPERLVAAALIALSAVVTAGAGTMLGSVLQGQFESKPTVGEERALDRVNAPQAPDAPVDPIRGPNRADLGGGR